MSRNDVKVILMARLVTTLSRVKETELILDYLNSNGANIGRLVEKIWSDQTVEETQPKELQIPLF